MAVLIPGPSAARAQAYGALGGTAAAALALLVAAGAVTLAGRAPVAAANALGAWWVRWLQGAEPQALDSIYPDATAVGLLLALAAGALAGAVAGGVWARWPLIATWAWMLGAAGLAWLALPALSPAAERLFSAGGLALLGALWGLGLGLWLRAGRAGRP
jgi:hypothetical protein